MARWGAGCKGGSCQIKDSFVPSVVEGRP
jgi:hypothetical protein